MKLGRNDPCRCGSGKKYKKCCLEKDEAAERAAAQVSSAPVGGALAGPTAGRRDLTEAELDAEEERIAARALRELAAESASPPAPHAPTNPLQAAMLARSEEFEAADYEGKIALFRRTLDEPELMDDEMVFLMMDALSEATAERGEHDRFEELAGLLQQRVPDVYAQTLPSLLRLRITSALAAGRDDDVRILALRFAEMAGEHIDTFNAVVERLEFHGYLDLLIEMMAVAWPRIQDSEHIVPWGIDEAGERASAYLVLDYVRRHPHATEGDPDLIYRMEEYREVEAERVSWHLAHVGGHTSRRWSMKDLDFPAVPQPAGREQRQLGDDPETRRRRENLGEIVTDFKGYAHREEGMPLTRAHMAAHQLEEYILERSAGNLGRDFSMMDRVLRPRKIAATPPTPAPRHVLVPDAPTMDRFVGGMFDIMGSRPYHAAAMVLAIPPWLRFLESHGLVNGDVSQEALAGLSGMARTLADVTSKMADDPSLAPMLAGWPQPSPGAE